MDSLTKQISLKYGNKELAFNIRAKNLLKILSPSGCDPIEDVPNAVAHALEKPVGMIPLKDILRERKPEKPLIIASDHTRVVPGYPVILESLMNEFQEAGIDPDHISLFIATGNHRAPSCEEREAMYGSQAFDQMNLYAHNCDHNCISLGKLSTGHEVEVNQRLLESDFIVATGKITPHYLAGFSGGRKAIMPGCASRGSIAANHAMIVRRKNGPGLLNKNPIHLISNFRK